MRDNKLHTPYGVRDYLPEIFALKTDIERKIEDVFLHYGFMPIKSPMFEYIEVFEGKGSIRSSQMYKFIGREGEILALRSDITPAIARIAATSYDKGDIPFRFCYKGNAFRYNESYQGKLREFTQAGIELIGVNSNAANGEVLAIAIKSLLATGLKDFKIDVGQVGFLKGILLEADMDEEDSIQIQNFILQKDFVAAEAYIQDKDIPLQLKQLLGELPMLIGSLDVIEKAKAYTKNQIALSALKELEDVYHELSYYGLQDYIRFDLSMLGHLDYYTGLIFAGYTYGSGFSILDGGRYDTLLSYFGVDLPSIGFAIRVSELMTALQNRNIATHQDSSVTLLVFAQKERNQAFVTADELRRRGYIVENSLFGEDIKTNMDYAGKKKINFILYFDGSKNIKQYDLQTGKESNTADTELLKWYPCF